jgi:serine phosphatase RsbU (regulator of sigma subunit)/anti-sigma regulatory factor (Ser/Thr protein kinase)
MTFIESIRRSVGRGRSESAPEAAVVPTRADAPTIATGPAIEIGPSDPLFAYLQGAPGVVDVDRINLDSTALSELRAAGVRVIVPLVTQGELIGALYLGPRLSDQDYSTDDRKLLSTLAAQAAPAIRVAQLVREQAVEIQARERLEQEMRVAALIQQQFLPRELPQLTGWQVAAYYGPARTVGGDFYDFIPLPEGRIGIVVGDVTDKGVPAALIMARTQSVLRGEAPRLVEPTEVLERVNEILVAEMPERMFVTCLYGVLDPGTGHFVYANAGHNPAYARTAEGVVELRATGMPLGLLEGMAYESREATLTADQSVVLYSDGIIEAHGPAGDMFGFPRLRELMTADLSGAEIIDAILEQLHAFTGPGWEQEDDITMVALRRDGTAVTAAPGTTAAPAAAPVAPERAVAADDAEGRLLHLVLPGEPGNERVAMDRVAEAVAPLALPEARLERLKTAVSEATMNAIEYGSRNDPTIPVEIDVALVADQLVVRITDQGLSGQIAQPEVPDIEAKLAGEQKPRGWGLFLIKHMVDAMEVVTDGNAQTVILTLHLEGAGDASTAL